MIINWHGPIVGPVGYPSVAREFIMALDKLGADVRLPRGIEGWGHRDTVNNEYINLFNKLARKGRSRAGTNLFFELPSHKGRQRDKVMMTLFETTQIPTQWVHWCNNSFKETWVPNKFNHDIFTKSGVRNVFKIPYGVNFDIYNPDVKKLNISNKFKFLSTFDFSYRKNPHGLITAYFKAFDLTDDVVLIIKTFNIPLEQFKSYVIQIKKSVGKSVTPRIIFIGDIVKDRTMAILYKTADCLLMPSYGEGWSLPCSSAMACKTPVIATNWSGHLEFMNHTNSYLINVKKFIRVVQGYTWYKHYMQWAEPDIDHFAFLMRSVYENQKDALEKAEKAYEDIKNFTWERSAKIMMKRCETI